MREYTILELLVLAWSLSLALRVVTCRLSSPISAPEPLTVAPPSSSLGIYSLQSAVAGVKSSSIVAKKTPPLSKTGALSFSSKMSIRRLAVLESPSGLEATTWRR